MSEIRVAHPAPRPAPRTDAAAPRGPAALAPPRESACVGIRSEALLGDGREVLIHHRGEVYRLRHTRNDKLILTK